MNWPCGTLVLIYTTGETDIIENVSYIMAVKTVKAEQAFHLESASYIPSTIQIEV